MYGLNGVILKRLKANIQKFCGMSTKQAESHGKKYRKRKSEIQADIDLQDSDYADDSSEIIAQPPDASSKDVELAIVSEKLGSVLF